MTRASIRRGSGSSTRRGTPRTPFTDPISAFAAKGATTSFIVDTQAPQVTAESPAPGSLVNSGSVTISFTVNKNLDPSTVNANTITVVRAGPDGVFGTADDVTIPLTNVAFTITPAEERAPGAGAGQLHTPAGLTNDLYQVTLDGAGSPAITDIAGNPLNGSGTPGTNFTWQFVVANPGAVHIIFVGPASDVTDPTATQGSRANPFPTINQAIAAAGVGDFVAVLPGVYTENVVLKSLVRVLSASSTSTDTSFQPGNALQTVIRAPTTPTAPATHEHHRQCHQPVQHPRPGHRARRLHDHQPADRLPGQRRRRPHVDRRLDLQLQRADRQELSSSTAASAWASPPRG